MKDIHFVCGMPRAGSTMLCNILNQNSEFHATDTANMAVKIIRDVELYSNSSEIISELAKDKLGTQDDIRNSIRDGIEGFYKRQYSDKVLFIKARGALAPADKIKQLWPNAKLICTIRDPRDVFASILKRHGEFALLDNFPGKTVREKAEILFSRDGMIGSILVFVENFIQHPVAKDNIVAFKYETFCDSPKEVTNEIYKSCGIPPVYEHDFNDIKNTAKDLDALYLYKFPHDGSGPVKPYAPQWQDYISKDLGNLILSWYPIFSQFFGYLPT